jgi:hypothetical protein
MIHKVTTARAKSIDTGRQYSDLIVNCGEVLKCAKSVPLDRVFSEELCLECQYVSNDRLLPFVSFWEDESDSN